MLLSKDPKDRGCVGKVKEQKFLNVDSTSGDFFFKKLLARRTEQAKQEDQKRIFEQDFFLSSPVTREIFQSAEKIMHSVLFEASEISTPTSFVMLPYKMVSYAYVQLQRMTKQERVLRMLASLLLTYCRSSKVHQVRTTDINISLISSQPSSMRSSFRDLEGTKFENVYFT